MDVPALSGLGDLLHTFEEVIDCYESVYSMLSDLFKPWDNRTTDGKIVDGKSENRDTSSQNKSKKNSLVIGTAVNAILKRHEDKAAKKVGKLGLNQIHSKKFTVLPVHNQNSAKNLGRPTKDNPITSCAGDFNIERCLKESSKNRNRRDTAEGGLKANQLSSSDRSYGKAISKKTITEECVVVSPLENSISSLFSESDLWHRKPSTTVVSVNSHTMLRKRLPTFTLDTDLCNLLNVFPSEFFVDKFNAIEGQMFSLLSQLKTLMRNKKFDFQSADVMAVEFLEYSHLVNNVSDYLSFIDSKKMTLNNVGFWLWYPHLNLETLISSPESLSFSSTHEMIEFIISLNELQEVQFRLHLHGWMQDILLPLLTTASNEAFYDLFKISYAILCTDDLMLPVLIDSS